MSMKRFLTNTESSGKGINTVDPVFRLLKTTDEPSGEREPVAVCYVVPCYAGPEAKQRGEGILARLADQARREGMATTTHLATIGNITDVDDKQRPMYPGVLLVADQAEWRDR